MPTGISIILFQSDQHAAQVVALWQGVFGYEDARNTPALVIDKKVSAGDGLFWVAEADGDVIGTVMAGYDGHRGWIYSLAVAESQRRKGIGSALMQHAEEELTRRGTVKINLQVLETNHAVADFYHTLGYHTEPRISMGKTIESNCLSQD